MKKRLFQILDKMNVHDTENNTKLVSISNSIVSAVKVKQGATVTIGADDQVLNDLLSGKSIALLVVVDKDEYFKRKEEKTCPHDKEPITGEDGCEECPDCGKYGEDC